MVRLKARDEGEDKDKRPVVSRTPRMSVKSERETGLNASDVVKRDE